MCSIDHYRTAFTYFIAGIAYRNEGNYVKSLESFQFSLQHRETRLGVRHPDTVKTYKEISATHRANNNNVEADRWLSKIQQ
jgi:hypothetical protein